MEGRERRKSHKEEEKEGRSGMGKGSLSKAGLYLDIYAAPQVLRYATANGRPVCLLSQDRFEELVCPCPCVQYNNDVKHARLREL